MVGRKAEKARMRLPIAGKSEGGDTQDEGPPDSIVPIKKIWDRSKDTKAEGRPDKSRKEETTGTTEEQRETDAVGICTRIRGMLTKTDKKS